MPDINSKRILPSLFLHVACSAFFACIVTASANAETWPMWRGPQGDNHAASGNRIPTKWNLETGEHVLWQTKIPGRGHSSPVITEDAIYLTTADIQQKTQSLLTLDRETGTLISEKVLHRDGLPETIHANNSHASPTPAFDGQHVFASFHTNDSIVLSKVTPEGQIVWQKKVADFMPKQFEFGYGASPVIEGDVVIVAAEYDGPDTGLYGIHRKTGKQVWKAARPVNLSFASPIVATVGDVRQVLLAGGSKICSYNPADGKRLWEVDESTDAICGTAVWNDQNVFISGGYPGKGTWCVAGDGTKEVVWDNRVKCYEQSLLRFSNHLLAVDDNGVGHCIDANNGDEVWQQRLFRGRISASPLLVEDKIYTASEKGNVVVISTDTNQCEILAKNPTGNSIFACPVVVDHRLYLRPATGYDDERQEYLVAIGSMSN